MENLLDSYCEKHGFTRYELAKVSGISEATWSRVNQRPLKDYTVGQLQSIGMMVDQAPSNVLNELWTTDLAGSLNGYRPYLDKYDAHDQKLERQLYDVIDQLAENGAHVNPFTFNRFDQELANGEVPDPQAGVKSMLKHTIAVLREDLKKIKHGEPPVPDDPTVDHL